ncbi:MAG: pro-sigmaK processing inhibitor BofA family protein [Methanomicrobiaceae archaeon]|nr:pro-sigmaK processing inhibitor BofA family protein [Methanomicrobiaceae archaeon]
MISTLITVLVAAGIVIVLWYFLKNVTTLIINSIVGIVTIVVISQLNILGMESFRLTWGAVLVCALGGLPGAILLIVLNFAGITI